MHDKGSFLKHEPCPSAECTSSDGFARYESGYGTCFVCDYYEYPKDSKPLTNGSDGKTKLVRPPYPVSGTFKRLRGISQKTMEFAGYHFGDYKGEKAHLVAVPSGRGQGHLATKIRLPNKQFRFVGDTENAGLIFQNLWPSNGKKLVICEGEFDALSVMEAQSCKWPVVSLPNGTHSFDKAFKNAFSFINSFEEVILWFDNDDAGTHASERAALLLEAGKCQIAVTPLGCNDANELLKKGETRAIIDAIWRASPFTPSRFVSLSSLKEDVLRPVDTGLPWIFDELTNWTWGRRPGETYFFGAGTGVGKTDIFTQQAAADISSGEKVALFSFEQTPVETAKRLAGKYAGHRFHIPDTGWSQSDVDAAFAELEDKQAYIYDQWGAAEWATVSRDITQLAHMGYRHFYIDHLTAFAAHATDERKLLESTCADMAQLAQQLGVNFYVISHLATPDGVPHEEGGRVFIRHFKGSRAIGYWAHFMFAIERDTQADDVEQRRHSKFRCLKDRYTGTATGKVLTLDYEEVTGRQKVDSEYLFPDERKQTAESHGFKKTTNDDF